MNVAGRDETSGLPKGQNVRRNRIRKVRIDIGVDFGTHSTKVIVRRRNEKSGNVMVLEEQSAGYPWFTCPSLVRIVEDQVYFGGQSLKVTGGRLFRSLKVSLLPTAGHHLELVESEESPDLLVTLYLSWILDQVRNQIDQQYSLEQTLIALNVGAPMFNYEDDPPLRYLRIVQAAWEAVFGDDPYRVENGGSIKQMSSRFLAWLDPHTEVPGPEIRRFDVLPETIAPIVSFSLDPQAAGGMYLIFDMGAGTTEVSINRVGAPGFGQKIVCYKDTSKRIGGDDFDRADREVGNVRQEQISSLISQLLKICEKTWYEGWRKDAASPAAQQTWRDLQVLLVGGGARRPEVEEALANQENHPIFPARHDSERYSYQVGWHNPSHVIPQDENSSTLEPKSLLAVANGLAIPRRLWAEYVVPSEVHTLPQREIEPIEWNRYHYD